MSSLEKAGGGEGQCLVSHMFAAEPKSPCERSLGPQAPGLRPFGDAPKLSFPHLLATRSCQTLQQLTARIMDSTLQSAHCGTDFQNFLHFYFQRFCRLLPCRRRRGFSSYVHTALSPVHTLASQELLLHVYIYLPVKPKMRIPVSAAPGQPCAQVADRQGGQDDLRREPLTQAGS